MAAGASDLAAEDLIQRQIGAEVFTQNGNRVVEG
jgi:hypothetical protein